MAGHRRGVNKPLRSQQRIARRRAFWRARLEAATEPCARVAVAADYLRVTLARAQPGDAERAAQAAAAELLRIADGLTQTGGADDGRAA